MAKFYIKLQGKISSKTPWAKAQSTLSTESQKSIKDIV